MVGLPSAQSLRPVSGNLKPNVSKIEAATWDEKGQLLTLKQDGWDINYENYTEINGLTLPNKIVLKSDKVNLKLLVEKWISVGS